MSWGQPPSHSSSLVPRSWEALSGGDSGGETPVPIPNTVVKAPSAEGTAPSQEWESRSPPGSFTKALCLMAGGLSVMEVAGEAVGR